jgi:drug/metabolite transporter (DMT)-like permease
MSALAVRRPGTAVVHGYAPIILAALIFGSTGVWVNESHLPSSGLLCLRMGIGLVVVAPIFWRRGGLRVLRDGSLALRLLAMGVIDAAGLLTFFVAMRTMNVAIAMFLSYLAPIYVAVAAPRVLHQPTERVVYLALLVALAGIGLMLVPGLVGHGVKISAVGAACGVSSGLLLGAYFLIVKTLRQQLGGGALLAWDAAIVCLAVLPLGVWQTVAAQHAFTGADVAALVALGVLNTALAGTLFLHGVRFVKVQHSSIVGLLEPVSAPLYAFVFLAQRPSVWTLAGGAMILAAGVLVVLLGQAEVEPVA